MSLVVDNLTKTFGEKCAVDHISFAIDHPGVFGLLGTNGAGKTTTIRMILGILEADEGTAKWEGKTISRETLAFGYLPEERGLYMKNKVLDQLVYFGMLRGMTRGDATKSANSLMDRLGMSEYAGMQAEKLSKGNQQIIQMIAAVVHDPLLIILDEPFSGLDPVNTDIMRQFLNELIERGKYIIMSSHLMVTIEDYCTDLAILNKGKTILQGNLREIKAGYGRTTLLVNCEQDISALAGQAGLQLVSHLADEDEYRITGETMANAFLKTLLDHDIYPLRYIVSEPTLHQIFVEKVGEPK